ncbi:MAG: FG-GAP repeat protein, partial [Chloroflexi bacterium]|nr:FG-GAP repeat protein [Chloroflexota bacterium]
WGEVKKLTASDAQAIDPFGNSVAVSDDSAVVGATGNDAKGFLAGAAYAFQRDEGGAGNWGEVNKLTASDAQAYDRFGVSVAVSGDSAIVGVLDEDAGGLNAGAAYVFQEPPPPVGGISLDSDLRSLPLETPQSSSPPWVVGVGIAGAACVFALGGAAWYARRRREGS